MATETAGQLLSRLGTSAEKWAQEFVERNAERDGSLALDEGTMISWFANAIMAGYDAARRKFDPELREQLRSFGIDPDS